MIFGLFVLEYKVEALGRARAGDQQPEQVREIQAAAGLRLPKAVIFLVLFRAVVLTTALVVVLTATDAGNVSCWRLCNDAKTCSCMCEFCEFCSLVQHSQLLQAGLVLCDIDLASSWPCELSREVAQVADNTHTHTECRIRKGLEARASHSKSLGWVKSGAMKYSRLLWALASLHKSRQLSTLCGKGHMSCGSCDVLNEALAR